MSNKAIVIAMCSKTSSESMGMENGHGKFLLNTIGYGVPLSSSSSTIAEIMLIFTSVGLIQATMRHSRKL